MINDRIAKACTETLAVLNNVPENEYYKIPKEFILMLFVRPAIYLYVKII